MKKSFILSVVFVGLALISVGQGKTLYEMNMFKPKPGMASLFESKWKTHLAMFHKSDNRRTVYEVMTGKYAGFYQIIEGPESWADMDVERADSKAHGLDIEKNFTPYIEQEMQSVYRYDDTSSYRPNVVAEKFWISVAHIKPGMVQATLREAKRANELQPKMPNPYKGSLNTYVQMMSGSDPVIVTVRSLKDGFKELEMNYYGPSNPTNAMKDAYIATYGQEDWDKRSKLLDDNANIVSRDVYLTKLRKDLSTP